MRRVLAITVLFLCCAGGAAWVSAAPLDAGDLDRVMGMLAMRQHGRVEFIEQQFLAVLSRPIESSGELRYDAPDRLEKRTLKPHAETLVLTGEVLTVERAHNKRVMDLRIRRSCRSSKAFAPRWRAIAAHSNNCSGWSSPAAWRAGP
jgi:hypothetical protein